MDYNKIRRKTKYIKIGNTRIGDDADVLIQSMTNTDTADANATINQIKSLEAAGCDIVRITVPDVSCANTIKEIKMSLLRYLPQMYNL